MPFRQDRVAVDAFTKGARSSALSAPISVRNPILQDAGTICTLETKCILENNTAEKHNQLNVNTAVARTEKSGGRR